MAIVNDFEGTAGGESSTAAHTLSFTPTSGNLLIAVLTVRRNNTPTMTGWTQRLHVDVNFQDLYVFTKTSNGAESSVSASLSGTAPYWAIAVQERSGVDTTDPIASSGSASSTSATQLSPTTSTNANGGEGFAAAGLSSGDATFTYSAGWTEGYDDNAGAGVGPTGGIALGIANKDTAFATGSAQSVTLTATGSADRMAAVIVELNPSAGGTPGSVTPATVAAAAAVPSAVTTGEVEVAPASVATSSTVPTPADVGEPSPVPPTRMIGFSVTNSMFDEFIADARVDSSRFELLWNGGGTLPQWADPDYTGWDNTPLNELAVPFEQVMMHCSMLTSNESLIQPELDDVITNIRDKYGSSMPIILFPLYGGYQSGGDHGGTVCQFGGNDVNDAEHHEAVLSVLESTAAGDALITIGPDVHISDCAYYEDDIGHLLQAGQDDAADQMAAWVEETYAASSAATTPGAVAAAAAVPSATPAGPADADPSVVAGTMTAPASSAAGAAVSEPSDMAAPASVPAPSPTTSATAAPGTAAGAAATPSAVPAGDAAAEPAQAESAASVPAAGRAGGAAAGPVAAATTVAVPTPGVQVSGTTTAPGTVTAAAAVETPDVSGGAAAAASVIAALSSVPGPSTVGGAVVVSEAVAAVAAVGSVVTVGPAAATSNAVAAVVALAQPTISAGGSATVLPSSVDAAAAVPAVTLVAPAAVSATLAAAAAQMPQPEVLTTTAVSPGVVVATVATPGVATAGGGSAVPGSVSVVVVVPSVSVLDDDVEEEVAQAIVEAFATRGVARPAGPRRGRPGLSKSQRPRH